MLENPLPDSQDLTKPLHNQVITLGKYESAVLGRIYRLEEEQFCPRLWRKDPTLWKSDPKDKAEIINSLGWLHAAGKMEKSLEDLLRFVAEVRTAGFSHVVHMGMGGSSLAPLAFKSIYPRDAGALNLSVLDTTDPATLLKTEREIPMRETLFIVASKSGTTAETRAFGEYFFERVKFFKGDRAGESFVAITDPGTPLEQLARERGFRRIFFGFKDVGGRYSALSHFGLVPAALMGVNVVELLVRARRMEHACTSGVPTNKNPGVVLGAVIGELARLGRDKITLLMSESIAPLGLWLEQLLAESTGKEGTGILPVAGEPTGPLWVYGEDRLFVRVQVKDEVDGTLECLLTDLQKAGHPLVKIQMEDCLDLAQEFFRWEMATATAGAILRINPFDQPNVQESKDNTNHLLKELCQKRKMPELPLTLREGPIRYYGGEPRQCARDLFKAFFALSQAGNYLAIQAYLPETPATTQALQAMRGCLRDALGLTTSLGYGPRFLHSTGQFHKGGPNTGLFLQLTAEGSEDAPIPGTPYTFGSFKDAQALGDLIALKKYERRVLRVHLGVDVLQGLDVLSRAVGAALEKGSRG